MKRTKSVKPTRSPQRKLNAKQQERFNAFANGLFAAIFGGGSFPGLNYGMPGTQAVSQVGNIFDNLRWYLVSNFRQQLAEAYCQVGLIQTIVNVPVEDGLRDGVEIHSKQLSPDQLKLLQAKMERQEDLQILGEGLAWTRLFGGGGELIMTDEDPKTPLDIARLPKGAPVKFKAVDMWELYYDQEGTEGEGARLQDEKVEFYDYYGQRVHRSRVIKHRGLKIPSYLRPMVRGWGLSVVEILVRSINQYLKGTSLIYELLDEAKIDVYGIYGLAQTLLTANGQQTVQTRIQMANQQKNFQHALVMDREDTYTQKTLTFSGLADVMREIRYQVASDLRMPLTKIFGISASGFNSGEDDLEVYNGMVKSTVRVKASAAFLAMTEIRCQQMFGFIPDDLTVTFHPMRLLSAEQEEAAKSSKFTRISQAFNDGAITLEEYRSACNKNNLLEIQLEPDALDELGEVGEADEGADSDEGESGEDE